MQPLIDTHAHLDFPEYADDLAAVVERARAAGVTRIITIGCDVGSSRRAVAIAEEFEDVFAVVGIHPNAAHEVPPDWLTSLRELAAHPRVVALGECGLDYHWLPETGREERIVRQHEVFRAQLALARETGLSLVVHQRACWDETLAVLRERVPDEPLAVLHCFGGTAAQATEALELGLWVSFTGIVTFKNAADVRISAALIPADRIMVETDAPFLAPTPHRGKRCEPAHVRLTAACLAQVRGLAEDEFAALTTANAERFFQFARASKSRPAKPQALSA